MFPQLFGIVSQGVFSPDNIANLRMWLDASDIDTLFQDAAKTTPVTANGQNVGAWADKSGQGNDLVATSSFPVYTAADINGLATLAFTADPMRTGVFSPDMAQPVTYVIAGYVVGTAASHTLFDGRVDAGKRILLLYAGSGTDTLILNAGVSLATDSAVDTIIVNPFVLLSEASGATSKIYLNGGQVTKTGNSGSEVLSGITVGAAYNLSGYFGGAIGEILVYNAALSEIEMTQVLSYLGDKWGVTIVPFESPAPLALTAPIDYTVIQRSGGVADIDVTGTYFGSPTAIEYQIDGGGWATLDAAPAANAFGGTISAVAEGQHTLEIRYSNDTGITDSCTFGVGDVYIIAGQSNGSGRGTNNQSYSHATLNAGLFANDYAWKELVDPSDSSNGQVDVVSSDSNAAGSPWPLLATSFMADQGVPCAFVPCAMGGTTISEWQKGADNDRATLYGSMQYRFGQLQNGAAAIIWWQGESDVVAGTSEATYNTALDSLAASIAADINIPFIVCKLQDMSTYLGGYDESAINSAITTAWGDNANVTQGPDFSDITPSVDGVHFVTDGELSTAASRWWAAIQTALGY